MSVAPTAKYTGIPSDRSTAIMCRPGAAGVHLKGNRAHPHDEGRWAVFVGFHHGRGDKPLRGRTRRLCAKLRKPVVYLGFRYAVRFGPCRDRHMARL